MIEKDEKQSVSCSEDIGAKKVRRIAAVIYIIVMIFVVGGSWVNQQNIENEEDEHSEFMEFTMPEQ